MASPGDLDARTVPDQRFLDSFVDKKVSEFLEVRCATLDCHGQLGRPLRLYSARGLRYLGDGGNIPGGAPTTREERVQNYRSVVGLQPEEFNRVVAQAGSNPQRLLLVSKPAGLVPHKGGTVNSGLDERCLTSWLAGDVDVPACETGIQVVTQ